MRREAEITIITAGRDKGKIYRIRELNAVPAEEWFTRAMQMLIRAGVEVPPNILQEGAMGFVTMGIGACLTGLGKAPYEDYKMLMDQMLVCITGFKENPSAPWIEILPVILDQTEEVGTLIKLREEIISLHLGFSLAAKLSNYREAVVALINGLGLTTETSPSPSQS
jgi:hypothetical protein